MYTYEVTDRFVSCMTKYPNQRAPVKRFIDSELARCPYTTDESHLLGIKNGIDLSGKRSVHFAGKYVLLFAICEECVQSGYTEANACPPRICAGEAREHIILIAFGEHDYVYERTWEVA